MIYCTSIFAATVLDCLSVNVYFHMLMRMSLHCKVWEKGGTCA